MLLIFLQVLDLHFLWEWWTPDNYVVSSGCDTCPAGKKPLNFIGYYCDGNNKQAWSDG